MRPSLAILLLFLPLTQLQQNLHVPSAREQTLAGIYEVRLGQWRQLPGSPVPQFDLPKMIELKIDAASSRSLQLAPEIPELLRRGGIRPSWRVDEADTLRLGWSTGYQGIVISAAVSERDSLMIGYVKAYQDDLLGEILPDGSYRAYPLSWAPVVLARVK